MASQAGWYGLLAIYKEARDTYAAYKRMKPLACPNDGEPLQTGPDGQLFCKFDGWRPGSASDDYN